MSDEVDFLHADKHESLLQVDNYDFDGDVQAFPKFPKWQVFSLVGILAMQGWNTAMRHEVTRNRSTKKLKHTGNLFGRNLQLKGVC